MKFEKVQVSESSYPTGDYRRIDAGRMTVWDYASSEPGFKEREINVHGVDLSTIKQQTRTVGTGSAKFKVKVISFADDAGIIHEITLFSK